MSVIYDRVSPASGQDRAVAVVHTHVPIRSCEHFVRLRRVPCFKATILANHWRDVNSYPSCHTENRLYRVSFYLWRQARQSLLRMLRERLLCSIERQGSSFNLYLSICTGVPNEPGGPVTTQGFSLIPEGLSGFPRSSLPECWLVKPPT